MPRNRTVRTAVLGVPVRRPAAGPLPSRTTTALRRRGVVGALVLVALVLLTVSFRESDGGAVGSIQGTGAAVLHPFEVATTRVARPFRDAYSWFDSLVTARSDARRLRRENEQLRQALTQNETATREAATLKGLLDFKEGPSYPGDFKALAASVTARPSSAFVQAIVVAVGSADGVTRDTPVVTQDGLIGLVTRVFTHASRVTLLTDESSAVSAIDVRTGAAGIIKHGGTGSTLGFSRVPKTSEVHVGDLVVTAGWRSPNLTSLYPKGIPIGRITSFSNSDTDLYKQVQVEPFADFSSIDAVLVLVKKAGTQP